MVASRLRDWWCLEKAVYGGENIFHGQNGGLGPNIVYLVEPRAHHHLPIVWAYTMLEVDFILGGVD
jgi:hypothetical protein